MHKILLILQREYLTRVQKKSFILMTLLGPLLMGGITIGAGIVAATSIKDKTVQVIDESGLFKDKFKDSKRVKFVYSTLDLPSAKRDLSSTDYQALLYIPQIDIKNPKGIVLFAEKNVSIDLLSSIEDALAKELENVRLLKAGIDRDVLKNTQASVTIKTVSLGEEGEKDSNTSAAFGIAYACAFLIYISIFIYGAQIMRGVLEEKTNRIVEVIISSVKPFQLMMGKITGIGLVGLTQFLLWIVLGWGVVTFGTAFFLKDQADKAPATQTIGQPGAAKASNQALENFNKAVDAVNLPYVIGVFLFYFLGGYLLYSALFAAIGSAVDSETDTQQFMLPITIPLIASFIVAQVVLQDPDGKVAFWMSMIPFTSPIIMMVRVPFGVPLPELLLSMALLVAGFIGTTWLAARIYRVGILMYGKKVNFRELSKWIFYKA